MQEVIYFVITIAILVFVHEFGHFAAAKLSGMRVDAFAIGFGFRLFGYNKLKGFSFGELAKDFDGEGNTDYRLCLFPFGGYVKIAGMVDESMDTEFANKEPQPYEFRSKSTIKKVFVITAGVMMNLILSLLIFWGSNFFYGKNLTKSTVLGVVETESLADSLGFKTGDKIVSVNGANVVYWEDVRNQMFIENMGKDLNVKVQRENETLDLFVPKSRVPSDESQALFLLIEDLKPVIGDVMKDNRADKAGIKANDIILRIDSTNIYTIPQTIKIISESKEKEISLAVLREKDTVNVSVVPGKDGKIGIALAGYTYMGETERVTHGFFESFILGGKDIVRMTDLTLTMMKRVISGDVEFGKAFGGPIKIAQFAAKSADSGFASFMMFLGLLSLSLAILNIMPFPVLDGGHLVIILIEGIMKREIPIKVKIVIQNTGLALLLLLMAFIIYNDFLGL
ncbi:MAG TPA: RIP metalloprotease RseP [Ignavibacteriaceae bacterium]|nr:RIP metalloprotease RseP [Ignavibacteriaceae bacterium]